MVQKPPFDLILEATEEFFFKSLAFKSARTAVVLVVRMTIIILAILRLQVTSSLSSGREGHTEASSGESDIRVHWHVRVKSC